MEHRSARVKVGGAYRGPTDIDGLPIGSLDDHFDFAITIALEDYWDDKGDYSYRPSHDEIIHPNGRGRVQKRILQASFIQELRALDLVVKIVRSRSNKYLYLLIRGPTQKEWSKKVWVPFQAGLSDIEGHIPGARPLVFAERVVNCERDKRLASMGVPLVAASEKEIDSGIEIHEVQVLMGFFDYWADKYKIKYLCREREKGFRNFHLEYEFNQKHMYRFEGEHNVAYEGPLVALEDLDYECTHGEMKEVANKYLDRLKRKREYIPPEQRVHTKYILNPEKISYKAEWDIEGYSVLMKEKLQQQSEIERYQEANEVFQAQGFKQVPIPKSVLDRKISWNQHEMYLERHHAKRWFSRGHAMSKGDWLQDQVLRNRMRSSFLRADIVLHVIKEACKPRVAKRGYGQQREGDDAPGLDTLAEAAEEAAAEVSEEVKKLRDNAPRFPWEATPGMFGKSSVDMDISQLIQYEVVNSMIPLHEIHGRRWLQEHWGSAPFARLLLSSDFWLCRSPVDQIRDYYGEETAFYFALLGTYTRWLYLPGLVGLGVQLYHFIDPEARNLNDSLAIPLYTTFLALWAMAFIQNWRRYEAELQHRWGVSDLSTRERVRPEFVGTQRTDPYTEEPDFVRESGQNWEVIGGAVFVGAVALVITYAWFLFGFQATIRFAFGAPELDPGNYFWFYSSIGMIAAVANVLFDGLFTVAAEFITNKENQKTYSDHEDSLMTKLLAFYLLSSNITLFYLAFRGTPCRPVDRSDLTLIQEACSGINSLAYNSRFVVPDSVSPWNYETGQVAFDNASVSLGSNGTNVPNLPNPCYKDYDENVKYCQLGTSMSLLGLQLGIMFGAWQALSLCAEMVIPWLQRRRQRKIEAEALAKQGFELSDHAHSNKMSLSGRAAEECQAGVEAVLPRQMLTYQNIKLVMQFSYVTLFASTWPLVAFLALLNNILQRKADAYRITKTTRRPHPRQAQGIGMLNTVITFLAYTAVLTNALILGVTSSSLGQTIKLFGFQVGHELEGVWRYNTCSKDAAFFEDAAGQLRIRDGVCLPLKNFHENVVNGFVPGEEPFEQQYTFLWAMVIMEHCVLLGMYLIDMVVPDLPAWITAEKKGQRQWLDLRAMPDTSQFHADFDQITGKFGMRELYNLITSTDWIKREINRTRLESDFNTSTGLPKRRNARGNFADNVTSLDAAKKDEPINIVTTSNRFNQSQSKK